MDETQGNNRATDEERQGSNQATEPDNERYTLDLDDAASLFREAGVPLQPRTLSRYCQKDRLDCVLHPVDQGRAEKYFINEASVRSEIKKIQGVKHRATARLGTPEQDEARLGTPEQDSRRGEARSDERVAELEEKVRNAEFEKAIAYKLAEDRGERYDKLLTDYGNARQAIGTLETELRQLTAGKPAPEATIEGEGDQQSEQSSNSISENNYT